MSVYTGGSASRTCPNCNYPIPPGRRALCPNCHHPLIFDEQDEKPGAIADTGLVKPTHPDYSDDTVITDPGPPPPPPIGGPPGRTCQSCGHVNPPNQLRCERCATSLDQQPAMPLPPPPPPPPPPPNRTGLAVAVVALALVAAVGLGFVAYRVAAGPGRTPTVATPPTMTVPSPIATLTANPTPTPQPELKRVKQSSIKAKASSTLPPQGRFDYDVENTLDRDPDTAWNSHGERVGAFARVTLTYRFATTIELRALEIYNGYQLSDESYYNNSRVRRVLVTTDATKQSFELLDKKGRQTLAFDFGQTKRVVLTIEAVYRDTPTKTKYKDCAVSDVSFYRI